MGLDTDMMGEIIGALLMAGEDDASGADDDGIGELIGALTEAGADDDASGADDLATLLTAAGALPARGGSIKNAALANVVKQQVAKNRLAKVLQKRGLAGFKPTTFNYKPPTYDKPRIIPMGFDSGVVIPAGATATITQRPQVPFRPARLVVPSDFAGVFLIADLKVGNKSQLAANSALPARMFQEDATDSSMLLDTATPALDVVLIVQNIGGAPQRFIAGLKGPAVE